jgi:hypothetical protein
LGFKGYENKDANSCAKISVLQMVNHMRILKKLDPLDDWDITEFLADTTLDDARDAVQSLSKIHGYEDMLKGMVIS